MGSSSSKFTFDRRNSVERRTQRRVLYNIKEKVKKIDKDVKKFDGFPGDAEYERLTTGISSVQKELLKKHPTLQPKNKATSVELQRESQRILEVLVEKAKQNELKQSESNNNKQSKQQSEDAQSPRASSEIRQTVELRVIKVESPEQERPTSQTSSLRSPEETRKSILKVGVPVMPNAAKEMKRRLEQNKQVEEADSEEVTLKLIEGIKKQVEDIELRISEFVGLKDGVHYTQIKDELFKNWSRLKEIPNKSEIIVEQKELCVQYIRSCLNFLDEKAETEVFSSDNEDQAAYVPPKGMKATLI